MPNDEHCQGRHRSRSPVRERRNDAEPEEERKRKRLERLQQWKRKQGLTEENTFEPAKGAAKEAAPASHEPATEEVDALDAFMQTEVMPDVVVAAQQFHARTAEDRLKKVKALASGKQPKRPKYLDRSDSDDEGIEIEIPTNKVKLVIGPNGTRIGDIQKKSKCRIQIQKTQEELNRAFGSGPEPKHQPKALPPITKLAIYGDAKGVAVAQRLIEEAVENKEQKRQQRQREYERKRSAKNRDRQIYHLRHARDYEALGLPLGASKAEAKKAYRKLAVRFHPDKYTGDDKEEAKRRFLEIQRAYQSLMASDEDQRIEQLKNR